jgi:glycerol kinase
VFDERGQIGGRAYREFTQHFPRPGWVEHDAAEIWDVTRAVAREALDAAGIDGRKLSGIGITNQRETIVAWDRDTGEPLHRAIVWQDRRTAARCDELRAAGHEPLVRERTGLVLDPYFSGTKIEWLLREGDVPPTAAFGTIDSWLVHKLTGAHVTDYSNASRTLLFDIKGLRWDPDLCELLGVPPASLPEPRPSAEVYGETTEFGGSVPVAGIAGDQQAALFGQACYGAGLAKNTYGTGSFLLMNTGTEPVLSEAGLLTTIAWGIGDEPVEYALEGAIFITGAAVQWLRDGLQIIADAAETESLAQSIESNDGVYFVPALAGLGAPHWDAYARGSLQGITRGTTRAHIARATLESICYQTLDVVAAMERDSGIRLKEVRVDGGAVGNGFLMQFQADILGVPIIVPLITETTSLGAASLAGLAVGFWQSRAELGARWQMKKRYEPQLSRAERERLHGRWLKAVERARDWARE